MNQTSIFDYLCQPLLLEKLDNLEIIVSNYGDIFTTPKNNIRKNGRKDNRKGKKLKLAKDKDGYLRITFENGLKSQMKRDKVGRFCGKEVM